MTKEEYISLHKNEIEEGKKRRAVANEKADAKAWSNIRAERNQKLRASDWTQGADIPDSIKTPYATYRQELRDITVIDNSKTTFWPTEPSI